ncbi:MAG TPA: sulfotransferase [Streptosporangiaceae bacterium]|nr:sulfotransferase [Streptosporangiaceae bacterium]
MREPAAPGTEADPGYALAVPPSADDCGRWAGACADPIFVLCACRSGSTLLRFLLDAHPDLACPPETELAAVCTQLAAVWSLLEGADLPKGQGDNAPAIPGSVIAGLRHTTDLMIGPYLARRGKKRYCDKSLGSARHVSLLLRMYPQARFLSLYRHPMDLIASGLEACPWGLNSYGFEHYVGSSPGNSVAALARYWADHTAAILAVEERYGARCHRVRYEDLVDAPDLVAGEIFRFAGLPPVPDISARAFTHERERFGRSDFKIWSTSRITVGSVGRGWSIPAPLIPAQLLTVVNDLAGKLGYRQVDETWGTGSRPADMLAPIAGRQMAQIAAYSGAAPVPSGSRLLGERITAGVSRLAESFTHRWKPHSAERFLVVATTPKGPGGDASWLVDLSARTVTSADGLSVGVADWRAAGTADAWERVIEGGDNMGVVFRRGDMRYADKGDAGAGSIAADTRVAMMADILGITTWPHGEDPSPSPVAR